MISERGLQTRIEIDGGIDASNIAEVNNAGAEIIVAGSAIYGKENPSQAVKELLDATLIWV
jgi:ribulose-phosphate 3-epimerase